VEGGLIIGVGVKLVGITMEGVRWLLGTEDGLDGDGFGWFTIGFWGGFPACRFWGGLGWVECELGGGLPTCKFCGGLTIWDWL